MADFMTVLAASKAQPTDKAPSAAAGRLPGDGFASVLAELSAQPDPIQATAALILPLEQPLVGPALADAMPVSGKAKPADSTKPADGAQPAVPADQASVLATFLLQAGGNPMAPASLAPPAAAVPANLPEEQAASSAVSELPHGQDLPARPAAHAGKAALPSLAATSVRTPDPAATEAVASEVAANLPAATDLIAATAAKESAAAVQLGTAGKPVTVVQATDLSSATALRGMSEAPVRLPETRTQVAVEAPVRSQAFAAEFSDKVVWLAGEKSQWASISLNPPQMGAIEVRLSLTGGDAGAQFYSPHPAVRDAIEAALPRLREMLAQSGITLGDSAVQGEAFSRRDPSYPGRSGFAENGNAAAPITLPVNFAARTAVGMVDLYV